MRILYLDLDAVRPDHLGCYGYHRRTSPTIDAIAEAGWRLTNCYASDTPCCPSRTSLFSGRFGTRQGVVAHAGRRAEPFGDGASRGFRDTLATTSWPAVLRAAGYRTASVSSFPQRHGAWWFRAGLHESIDTGGDGMESAHDVAPLALDWLDRHANEDRWFLHVNFWDAHTPYRVPAGYGEPFVQDLPPAWLDESVRAGHWQLAGPQGARERGGMDGRDDHGGRYPRQPHVMATMAEVRRMFDGYDTAIRYIDDHIAALVDLLRDRGVWDQTAVIVSADHGEAMGELNIYGCHQTADETTARVPMIVRWPGVTDRHGGGPWVIGGLHYHLDAAATVAELAGAAVPANWDGQSFARRWRAGDGRGRDHLVLSQMQGTCQRAVRFNDGACHWLAIFTWHDGFRSWPARMLFDLAVDPHEQREVSADHPEVVERAHAMLEVWLADIARTSGSDWTDPMATVLAEGGPPHVRGWMPDYLDRLRDSGRGHLAQALTTRVAQHA